VGSGALAIFTEERVLLYKTDPDMGAWELDTSFVVDIGTVGHRTIAASGTELMFASRRGIHSLRRSALNGLTVFTVPLSEKVTELYQALLERVPDLSAVSSCIDKDAGLYHLFLPISATESYRLTVALGVAQDETAAPEGKWTRSSYAIPTCADARGGRFILGTGSGFFYVQRHTATVGERGPASVEFPLWWHGDFNAPKHSHAMFLYASGAGRVTVRARDERDRELSTVVFDLPEDGSDEYRGAVLSHQFLRPFQHQYVGLRLSVQIEGARPVRVFAIGIQTREP
jgi:hypothetical protein